MRLPLIRTLGISARLYSLAGLAIVAVALLAAGSLYFAKQTSNAASTLGRTGLAGISLTTQYELLVTQHAHLVDAASKETDAVRLASLRQAARVVGNDLKGLSGGDGATGQTSKVVLLLPELLARAELVLELAVSSLGEKAREARMRYEATALIINGHIRSERSEHVTTAEGNLDLLRRNARSLVHWVLGTALAALLLIGPISLPLMRRVTVRLRDITRGMLRLAANDTSLEIAGTQEPDEIGAMARALQVFRSNAISLLDQQAQLEKLNLSLDVALNSMSRGLSMFDGNGSLIICNASYARMYDLPPELVVPGTSIRSILAHSIDGGVTVEASPELEATGSPMSCETLIVRGCETSFVQRTPAGRIISVSMQPIGDGGWVALHQDITEQRGNEARIERLARQDALTNLENRRGLREALAQACSQIDDTCGFAVHCIDLDKFKSVNDSHGHQAGDALLEAVARRLRAATRGDDVVARLGGDEFAVIQRQLLDARDARALGERLVATIGAPFDIRGHSISIGASVGFAMAPEHERDPEQLLRLADIALYAAKAGGRGQCVMFDPAMDEKIKAHRQLERDVREALAYSEMTLYFQPIIDLTTQRVAACEALMRWQHRERGFVSPAEFIPIAEETGAIHELGAWALAEATRVAASWPDDIKVSVNLSPAQFAGPDLPAIVAAALADLRLDPARLELEITESVLLKDDEASMAMLHQLRDLGVSISLDDFGTGYSSLSYLRSFPFSKLKIDQSFVRDLPNRTECVAIVQAVTTLARSLSMTTVAEGVETNDHLQRVRAAGCDQVQGYLFSKPVPAEQLERVFEECHNRARFAA